MIDAHSHEQLDETDKNLEGRDVIHVQTGTALAAIGKIVIDPASGEITHELVSDYTDQDAGVLTFIKGIEDQFNAELSTVVGSTSVDLIANDPATKERIVRCSETNLGDFCADAYRIVLDADIGFSNAGGIRKNLKAGDISIGNILSVYPFADDTCVISATGQQILDALELSASGYPEELGAFLQVSGISYTLDASVPTSVKLNDKEEFVSVEGTRRVKDVQVGGSPIDPAKTYAIAGSTHTLQEGGGGYSMFEKCTALKEGTMKDYETLKEYLQTSLKGTVGSDYSDPKGQGRITILAAGGSADGTAGNGAADGTAGGAAGGAAVTAGSSYRVVTGDCLWSIARRAYGDGSFWKKIYAANEKLIEDPDLIYPEEELTIPAA